MSLVERVATRFTTTKVASIWNMSWLDVSVSQPDSWKFSVEIRASRSPTGLVDDSVAKLCQELKDLSGKDISAVMSLLKVRPAPKVLPEAHVFLEGGSGGSVIFTFTTNVYARNDKQAEEIRDTFELHGAKLKK